MNCNFQYQRFLVISSLETVLFLRNAISFAMLAIVAGSATNSHAAAIDLSSQVHSGTYHVVTSFSAGGFDFSTNNFNAVVDAANETNPKLQHPSPGDLFGIFLTPSATGTFAPTGGGTFTLNSIDINWWDHLYGPENHNWTLTGSFVGGAQQSLSGVLAPDNFVRVTPNWQNLLSVTLGGSTATIGWIGVNNIMVNEAVASVPEPSTWAMMLIGFAGLGAAAFRASQKKGGATA